MDSEQKDREGLRYAILELLLEGREGWHPRALIESAALLEKYVKEGSK